MANEWIPVELYGANNSGSPRRYTIADGVAVSKGQLLSLVDPRTASASIVSDTVFAGVSAEEHLANVGDTSVAVWTEGIFEAVASSAITLGSAITGGSINANQVMPTSTFGGASILGYALETGSVSETINVRLSL